MRSMLARRGFLVASILAFLTLASSAAADDTVRVDFETGPALGAPITDQYRTSSFVFWNSGDYRPRRRAHGPGVVADIGPEHCEAEGYSPGACELAVGGTRARLTRSANRIAMLVGLRSAMEQSTWARLQALDGNGVVIAQTPETPIGVGITTPLSVARPGPEILGFRLMFGGGGATGGPVAFDDLELTYPPGSLPDLAIDVTQNTQRVVQGASLDLPLTVTRLNGSSGPIDLRASGLPSGVTAEFLPDPVPGTTEGATLRLRAATDAPDSPGGTPQTVTITADPQGDAGVGRAPVAAPLGLVVESAFTLRAPSGTTAALPTCGTVEVPLTLGRSTTFTEDVHLDVEGLPPGVTGTFSRGTPLAAGTGGSMVLALRASSQSFPPVQAVVSASASGYPSRRVYLDIRQVPGTVSLIAPQNGLLTAPQQLRPGTPVVLSGNGLCPGSTVFVGAGEAAPTLSADGTSMRFETPRLATSGPIRVVPSAGPSFATQPVTVTTFRSTSGLRFGNFSFTGLSYRETIDTFGADEFFVSVNPCWPWSDCSILTPVPNPIAVIAHEIIDAQMQSTGGHCFGISRAVQGWLANRATLNRWSSTDIFGIPGRSSDLDSYLDGQHATQASTEFIRAWFGRTKTVEAQLTTIRSQLSSGNTPLVSVREGDKGHAMVAYDVLDRPDGGADVLLYDNNVPFDPAVELSSPAQHQHREAVRSVLRITPDRRSWEFSNGGSTPWTGGGADLFAVARNVIPDDPSLPGLAQLAEGLAYVVFGSQDGSVRSAGVPEGGDLLPPLDSAAPPGRSATVGFGSRGALRHAVVGTKQGRYRQSVVEGDSLSTVELPTATGAADEVRSAPGGDGLVLAQGRKAGGGQKDYLVAVRGTDGSRLARIRTASSAGSEDVVRLAGGRRLTIAHEGAATTMRVELQSAQRNGGAATFTSGPIAVGRDATVTLTPVDWRVLDRVRVTVRRPGARSRTRTLRSRTRPAARVRVRSLRVRGRRVSVVVRFSKLPAQRTAAVVLRVMRGRRTVGRRSFPVPAPRAGTQTLRWTIPSPARARGLRLRADATLVVGGARPATVRASRTTPLPR